MNHEANETGYYYAYLLLQFVFCLIITFFFHFMMQDYDKFWENFGKHLKLGCLEDHQNHKRIAPLLRFSSSQSEEELISLDEYIENMKPEQKDIYYIAADSLKSARNAPSLEMLLEKDFEVSHYEMNVLFWKLIYLIQGFHHIYNLCMSEVSSKMWVRWASPELVGLAILPT